MDYIINSNLDLLKIVVDHFNQFNINEDILYKMGYKGLIKAAIKFDIFCNLSFRTFAMPYIIESIVNYLQ